MEEECDHDMVSECCGKEPHEYVDDSNYNIMINEPMVETNAVYPSFETDEMLIDFLGAELELDMPLTLKYKLQIQSNPNYMEISEQEVTINFLTGEFAEPIVGDVNEDGLLNVLDVVAVANAALDGIPPSTAGYANYDIVSDGVINVLDILAVVNVSSSSSSK